jgi:hypothetical protein
MVYAPTSHNRTVYAAPAVAGLVKTEIKFIATQKKKFSKMPYTVKKCKKTCMLVEESVFLPKILVEKNV